MNDILDTRLDNLKIFLNELNLAEYTNSKDKLEVLFKIKELKEAFFGVNNSYFLDIEDYITKHTHYNQTLGSDYPQETVNKYFNDLHKTFDDISKIEKTLYKNLVVTRYEIDSVYLKHYFNILRPEFYPFKLKSIFIKDSCQKSRISNKITTSYYEHKDENGETIKTYFEIISGEYEKNEINFNIHKKYIDYVSVIDSENNLVDIPLTTFEKKYGPIKWFIDKEVEEDYPEFKYSFISDCLQQINPFIILRKLPFIVLVDKTISRGAAGLYFLDTIQIKKEIRWKTHSEVLAHEIGHYIHETVFNNRQIRFPTDSKSHYAGKNYYENFAECFNDLTFKRILNSRTKKMISLLTDII